MKHYTVSSIVQQDGILYTSLRPKRRKDMLHFMAGQYATIGFTGSNGRPTPMRCFSIVSSAANPSVIQFATRINGSFTRALADLTPGADVMVQGPFGEFVIDERYDRNIVMIAGGIGITPLMSMLRTADQTGARIPVTLLYSCRSDRVIPFRRELLELEQRNPWLHVITFVTDTTVLPETPRLLSGRMTEQHLHEVVGGNFASSTYFVCGPKGFMDSTTTMLTANNVRSDRIITESFTQSAQLRFGNGYSIQKVTYSLTAAVLAAGIISIAVLDLSRYVPRHIQATPVAQTVTTLAPTTATTPTNDSSANPTNSSSSSAATNSTPTAQNSQPTVQTQPTYQSPTTSVS